MQLLFYLKLYALTVPIFFAIDLLWLGIIAKKFYRSNLGHILSDEVNWKAAIIFYLMYIVLCSSPGTCEQFLAAGSSVWRFVRILYIRDL